MDSNNNISDYYCNYGDKSVKLRSKMKHLITQYHQLLTDSYFSRYCFTIPKFLHIEYLLKNYVIENNKNLDSF